METAIVKNQSRQGFCKYSQERPDDWAMDYVCVSDVEMLQVLVVDFLVLRPLLIMVAIYSVVLLHQLLVFVAPVVATQQQVVAVVEVLGQQMLGPWG